MGIIKVTPTDINMKDLFLDVRLKSVSSNSTSEVEGGISKDFTGKKTFNAGFFRKSSGFGITDINIEINASLQPIVEITFKDLYGNTVFGRNQDNDEVNFGTLFDWPPPKFLFTFKGYLGRQVSWILNLKKTDTNFNPDDASFSIKATFVPNFWGFFSDLPFLYLYAVKKLKEDESGTKTRSDDTQVEENDSAKNIETIFDLINVGREVRIKTQETTKEYDFLLKKLSVLKTGSVFGIINGDLEIGEVIDGKVSGRAPIEGFKPITITLPSDYTGTKEQNLESLRDLQKDPGRQRVEHQRILAATISKSENEGRRAEEVLRNTRKGSDDGTQVDQEAKTDLQFLASEYQDIINDKIALVEREIRSQIFESSDLLLKKLTISEIFSQLSGDAAYILGQILRAGITGYSNSKASRDEAVNNKKIIGRYFPLKIESTGIDEGKQVPAEGFGIREPGAEMDFVNRFIEAVSFGIAESRKDEASQDLSGENKLIKRINNLDVLNDNPYTSPSVQTFARNVLVNSGIAGFMTRSFDPNLTGDYGDTSFLPDYSDRDSTEDIRNLANKELENITDSYLLDFSESELEQLKEFLSFINKLFSTDGLKLLNEDGSIALDLSFAGSSSSGFSSGGAVIPSSQGGTFANDLKNLNILTRKPSINEADYDYNNALVLAMLKEAGGDINKQETFVKTGEANGSISLAEAVVLREQIQKNIDKPRTGIIVKNVFDYFKNNLSFLFHDTNNQTFLSSVSLENFASTAMVNNGVIYTYPFQPENNEKYFVAFTSNQDLVNLKSINNNTSDAEYSTDDFKDIDEPLGIVFVDTLTKEVDGKEVDLERIEALEEALADNRVLDYNKLVNRSDFGRTVDSSGNVTDIDILWEVPNNEITEDIASEGFAYSVFSHVKAGVSASRVFGLFDVENRGRNQRVFLRHVCGEVERKLQNLEDEKNTVLSKVLGKADAHSDLIYQQMHHLFHQWAILAGDVDSEESAKGLPTELEEEYSRIRSGSASCEEDGKEDIDQTRTSGLFKYDYPLYLNQERKINVSNSIINIEPLYKAKANTTILNIIQSICSKNNFLFFPIPGNANFECINEIFLPMPIESASKINNFFQVLFMPTPESRRTEIDDFENVDYSTLNGDAFEVEFTNPDNKVIKSLNVSTDENKVTAESIVNLQRIVDNENQNKTVTTDCSLLSVMEGRSYKATCDMLGNAQISPMQFFFIDNMPIFGGLYQIIKVNHSITPNNMNTSFEGIKLRVDSNTGKIAGTHPITLENFVEKGIGAKALLGVSSSNVNSTPSSTQNIQEINSSGVEYRPKKNFVGTIFEEPYTIEGEGETQKTIIDNPFYFSNTAKSRGVANTPDDGRNGTINQNIVALQKFLLKPIYDEFKEPISINSGYRNKRVNALVGGSVVSNHTAGLATDIVMPTMTNNGVVKMYNWIIDNWQSKKLPIKELILERGSTFWLHIAITDNHKYNPSKTNIFKIYDRKSSPQYVFQTTGTEKKVKESYNGRYPGEYVDGSKFGIA